MEFRRVLFRSAAGATESGTTVTITTTAAHGVVVGQTVVIGGVGVAGYNGTFVITSVPSPTTFTYTAAAGLAPSGGGTAGTGTIYLTGAFATANLGTINSASATVYLGNGSLGSGTLTNAGQTLTLNDTTGSWRLLGGTIHRGTRATTGSNGLIATTSQTVLAHGVAVNPALEQSS